ncbi:helix-turn-helix transcriptional regulator [Methylobacterium sp. D53M]
MTTTADELNATGERLRLLREIHGMHQAEWARHIGVTRQSWNNYEMGAARISIDAAMILLRKFGVSLDWIYNGEEAMLPKKIADPLKHLMEVEKLRKTAQSDQGSA